MIRTTAEVQAEAVRGCCGDDKWRGHVCQYHEGFIDGMEAEAQRLASDDPPTDD